LIKKIVFSDRLAVIVDQIFDSGISGLDYMTFNSASLFLGALAFSFQIYLDFSAYTDIARGLGKILGINLIQNFNHPYRASSFKDFWRRWHISLSTWFRDYVFIPLGGSRRSFSRTQINILIVFTISGLWHGANYNFILWGILHGIMLCFENTFNNFIKNYRAIWRIVTQLLIILLWIFFRSEGPLQAVFIISKILLPTTGGVNILSTWNLALILISFLFIHYESYLRKFAKTKIVLIDRYPIFSGILYSFVISSIFILKEVTNDFVYFQF
jgi:alginate O-acetyltransferase complex protein AlgI